MTTRKFLFLLASARQSGNSETLARRAAARLSSGVKQSWIRLDDFPLKPFVDIRHPPSSGIYPAPDANGQALLDATLEATDLVFVVPLYWYGPPAAAKLYLDHWSGWLRVPGVDFRQRMEGKTLWGVISVSDEDQRVTQPLIDMLRLTADYMKMSWGGTTIGFGNLPKDVLSDQVGLGKAERFFGEVGA